MTATKRIANNGVQAIELSDEFKPNVIILDIGMPRLDGVAAARVIRSRDWSTSSMLVALTGWGQAADRMRTKEAGFDVHLVKPVQLETLHAMIEQRFD